MSKLYVRDISMDRNLRGDMEFSIRALRRRSGSANGCVGAEARGAVSAGIWGEISEEEIGDAAGGVVE